MMTDDSVEPEWLSLDARSEQADYQGDSSAGSPTAQVVRASLHSAG